MDFQYAQGYHDRTIEISGDHSLRRETTATYWPSFNRGELFSMDQSGKMDPYNQLQYLFF